MLKDKLDIDLSMATNLKPDLEDLELSLNIEEASALFLLLDTAIDTLRFKSKVLKDVLVLEIKDRPEDLRDPKTLEEVINLNSDLKAKGIYLQYQVGNIIKELGQPKKPKIIPSPKNWAPRK